MSIYSEYTWPVWGSRPSVATPSTHPFNDVMKGTRGSYHYPMTLNLDDFDVGRTYKVQLFFMDRNSNRGFDIFFNDRRIVKEFSPYYLQDYTRDGSRLAVLSHTFSATEKFLKIALRKLGNSGTRTFTAWGPILNAVTVEEVGYYCPAGSSYPKEAPEHQQAIGGTKLTRSGLALCSKGKVYFVYC